ncbi:MAG: thermonuclease family protein [Anaerolineae bacterium]
MLNNLTIRIRLIVGSGSIFILTGLLLVLLSSLTGCAQITSDSRPGAIPRTATVVLPTGAPKANPTPTSTRVVPATVFTPGPTPTITPIPDTVRALVVSIIDGDTIEVVMDGDPQARTYKVRYLGVEAPPNSPSVPWGAVAFETNLRLTNGKIVRLERDQSEADSEGRLLRHVFLGDELLSVRLAEQGLARAKVVEPDTQFKNEILEAETRAKAAELGVWGPPPTPTPKVTLTQSPALTITVVLTITPRATIKSEATEAETPTPASTDESDSTETPTPAATLTSTTEIPTAEFTSTPATSEDLQGPQ